jgi:hypothetical protein
MNIYLETLCRQHDELRALADTYENELKKPGPDLPALAKCRWMLARLVSGHLAYERLYLYGTLASRGDTSGLKLGERLDKLGARLSEHVRDWTPQMIADDWTGYGQASVALIKVLRAHMDEEERELYPRLLAAKAA